MDKKSTVLIADDRDINREILKKILSESYEVLEAGDGKETLQILKENPGKIAAIILDLIMPGMSGMEFLEIYTQSESLKSIPLIVSTGDESNENEVKCLELGAWDFIRKPYHAEVIQFRVKNVIERSELKVLKELQYLQQFDSMTGIYKKDKFINRTKEMFFQYPEKHFLLVYFDICKFQTFNAVFGMSEGDCLLKYIAELLRERAAEYECMTYGREEADVFLLCQPYEEESELVVFFKELKQKLNQFKQNYDVMPNFGIYVVDDKEVEVHTMIDHAKLASKCCKGNYIRNYAYYADNLEGDTLKEQEIINSMNSAMRNEEFVLYLQPKYELMNNTVEGGEVLVRWKTADGKMVSPGEFIPIFEKNGFIMELDYYIWEHACMMIRKWMDEGKNPFPISVNISRISLYNSKLVQQICDLVQKYDIPPALFQLELTESAYTNNPMAIKEAMHQLQKKGFYILMDDFGSGYSSLNVLKDIAVDVLKIDMKFMSKCDMPGRSENILASVVRMAKWLNMPVIAEGVETAEQVSFLRSIGCEFVQGYYFAKPMPPEEYEALAFSEFSFHKEGERGKLVNTDSLWNSTSQMEILFSNMLQAVAVYEFDKGRIEVIRVNNAYYDMFGYLNLATFKNNLLDLIVDEYRDILQKTFETVVAQKGVADCEYQRQLENGKFIWVSMKLKYINLVGEKHVIFGILSDITMQKEVDRELQKYRTALSSASKEVQTILVVDDMEVNRGALNAIFQDSYNILEAKNGQEALEVIREHKYGVDIILLDLMMPVMDGPAFLKEKNQDDWMVDIPVIIITADDTPQQQINTLQMGANDYIVKPFVPEIVVRRVCNVLESNKRFGEVLRGCNEKLDESQKDQLTGFYKKDAAEQMIGKAMARAEGKQAMLLIDLDNLKELREQYGLEVAQEAIRIFADRLRNYFRQSDIVARYSGDEFLVFMDKIPDEIFIRGRCSNIINEIQPIIRNGKKLQCSIGVAFADKGEDNNIMKLIQNADRALFEAKKHPESRCISYQEMERAEEA